MEGKEVGLKEPPATGAELITTERERQMSEEGYHAEHDDGATEQQLALAAACYILDTIEPGGHCGLWPWNDDYFKPTRDDPIRQLTKAGALVAAEIDRIQRSTEGMNC